MAYKTAYFFPPRARLSIHSYLIQIRVQLGKSIERRVSGSKTVNCL